MDWELRYYKSQDLRAIGVLEIMCSMCLWLNIIGYRVQGSSYKVQVLYYGYIMGTDYELRVIRVI